MAAAKTVHTLVIGSGLAGLSCARMLAVKGKSVAVLEKAPVIGGHLLPFNRGGAHFEVGIHYIADTAPESQWGRACRALGIEVDTVPLDPEFEQLRFPGKPPIPVYAPLSRFRESLEERFPAEKKAIRKWVEALDAIYSLSDSVDFPYRTIDMFKAAAGKPSMAKIAPLSVQTLDQYLRGTLGVSKELYEVLAFQHVLIGVPPERLSAAVYMLVHRYYFESPCFVSGGGQALIDALLHPAVDYRTRIDARISRVPKSDGTKTPEGLPCRFSANWDGETINARHVVWTADPRLWRRSSDIRPNRLTRWRLSQVETPHALVVGYFATGKPLGEHGIGNRNYWLMGTLDSHQSYSHLPLEELARRAPIYMSTGSLRDPYAIEPGGKIGARGVFQAMFLVPPDPGPWGGADLEAYRRPSARGGYKETYYARKDALMPILKDRVFEAFPSVRDDLVWEELGTPLTHARYLNSITLNGYGYSPTVFDFLIGRPGYETGVDGFYFCGQHIKPAHGITTVLVNGTGMGKRLAAD